MQTVDAQYVRAALDLDCSTGDLRWRIRSGRAQPGALAGWDNAQGYREIQIQGKIFQAHRIVWLHLYGVWPSEQLDHKDRNRKNNAPHNLREASNIQNSRNRSKHRNNTTGVSGVRWHKPTAKWRAAIRHKGKSIHLGLFDDIADAAAARERAEKHYYGEFAVCRASC